MKSTNSAKKQTSQDSGPTKNASSHIKIVKPRPNGTEVAIQGPRDCIPLG